MSTPARAHLASVTEQLGLIDVSAIDELVVRLTKVRAAGRFLLIAGDGGSAALAAHLATDLLKLAERGVAPGSIALTENAAALTMLGNDRGFESVFAAQIAALARPGDAVLLISGSGRSPNLLRAAEEAHAQGAEVLALLGFGDGGPLARLADAAVTVPSRVYGVIEDSHQAIAHAIVASLAALVTSSRVAVLDRDGVLGIAPPAGEYVEASDGFRWAPRAIQAVAALKRAGWTVVVATNQRGVALGRMTPEAVDAIHDRMNADLAGVGATIDGFFVCPHDHADACVCRKPGLGLIEEAGRRFGFKPYECVLVGDTDIEEVMGQRAGCRTIIVGRPGVPDLAAAVERMLGAS